MTQDSKFHRGIKNNFESVPTLLVWDVDGAPPVGDWTVIRWRDFEDDTPLKTVSIPRLVETHADELKKRYLAWVYELGERRIHGRRIVDHMQLRTGFSYWWMTLFAEKCNYAKSPQITDAIRLMAFDKWAEGRSFGRVVLVSANQSLVDCVRSWCVRLDVAFEWRRISDEATSLSWIKRLHQFLPLHLQALTWLVHYLLQSWPLRGVGLQQWRETKGRVTFVSYLFNLVPDAAKNGRYESRYWAHLPNELQREGCKINWLHLYVKDALLPTAQKGANAIREFNETGRGEASHVTLDTFIDTKVVFKTLRDWYGLIWMGGRLRKTVSSTQSAGLDIWPLFDKDWQQSFFGPEAIRNVLHLNLLESAMESLPKQRVGVYLQENQGWEIALNFAWKAAGHGRLIGTPHSTVRYWDLRYFFDPRSYHHTGDSDLHLPLPDLVALNGAAAMDAYLTGGYPEASLVNVEALRYLYLEEVNDQADHVRMPSVPALRVLVLGDFLLSNTQQQMRLLEKAVQSLPNGTIFIVKPHPACPIQPADYPGILIEITMEPVSKLMSGCDVAYTSAVTSAAVDAYCSCVPVVSVLDPNGLNLSPLRSREGVLFPSTPAELASALISAAAPRSLAGQQEFFTLDPKLPRWRKLLLECSE